MSYYKVYISTHESIISYMIGLRQIIVVLYAPKFIETFEGDSKPFVYATEFSKHPNRTHNKL